MTSIPLYLTEEYPCSYLENKLAQSLFVHPSLQLSASHYRELLKVGFRRSGNEVYRPNCAKCNACIPARLAVADFKPSRAQKRCFKKNIGTRAIIKPATFQLEHFEMYIRYQKNRHSTGSMAHLSADEYLQFLDSFWCNTRFVEFTVNNTLAAVAVVDQFDDAWSAVYTFFEPKFANLSLGVFAVLWEIEQAKLQQKEFLYLGYWIKNCKKMAYKIDYQPIQLFINNQWTDAFEYMQV
jgi:leucyl-tRNA---protein transferase